MDNTIEEKTMSKDLQKKNGSAIVRASSQIIKALHSPQVTVADPQEIFKALNMACTKAYLDTGNSMPDSMVQLPGGDGMVNIYEMMVNDLVLYVRMKLGSLRVNEIPVAISNGVLGEAGEYYGLNKKSFVQFLTVYCQGEARRKQLAEHIASLEDPAPVPTFEDQFNTAKGNVIEAFAAHKNDKKIERLGVVVYDFLFSLGLINYGEDQNTRVYQYSKMRVINDLKQQIAAAGDVFARDGIRNRIEALQAGSTTDEGLIFTKAKTITMGKYFDDVILAGINLETYIEDRRPLFYKLLADRSNENK